MTLQGCNGCACEPTTDDIGWVASSSGAAQTWSAMLSVQATILLAIGKADMLRLLGQVLKMQATVLFRLGKEGMRQLPTLRQVLGACQPRKLD